VSKDLRRPASRLQNCDRTKAPRRLKTIAPGTIPGAGRRRFRAYDVGFLCGREGLAEGEEARHHAEVDDDRGASGVLRSGTCIRIASQTSRHCGENSLEPRPDRHEPENAASDPGSPRTVRFRLAARMRHLYIPPQQGDELMGVAASPCIEVGAMFNGILLPNVARVAGAMVDVPPKMRWVFICRGRCSAAECRSSNGSVSGCRQDEKKKRQNAMRLLRHTPSAIPRPRRSQGSFRKTHASERNYCGSLH
jgi:hypothetical protein